MYSLFTGYLKILTLISGVFYLKLHLAVYIPIIQHHDFLNVTPYGIAIFCLKSDSHQGLCNDFQCSQCNNTFTEGVCSKQKNVSELWPQGIPGGDFWLNITQLGV